MTAVNLPPPTSAPSPGGVGASFGLGGDRGSGGQSDSSDGSAFGSVLGALDEPAPRTAPASGAGYGETPAQSGAGETSASTGSWRTVSAVHALGSGVLVAFDKRLDSNAASGTATNPANTGSAATAPVGDEAAAPAAVASKGLASLIAGLTGMPPAVVGRPTIHGSTGSATAQAPRPAVRAALADRIVFADPAAPATLKPVSAVAGAGPAIAAPTSRKDSPSAPAPASDGATVPDPATLATLGWSSLLLGAAAVTPPSGAAGGAARGAANASATEKPGSRAPISVTRSSDVALATSAPPVEVKVVRSITYLGLDPTVRGIRPETSSPPAPLAAAPGGPARPAPAGSVAAPLAASATSDGASTPGGDHASGRNSRGGFASGSGSAAPATAPAAPADPIAVRAPPPGDLGALATLGAAPVPLSQLADVIANAAAQMQPSGDIAASTSGAAGGASAPTAPVKELDVKLNPASLGGLSIEMRLSDGKLAVTIKADKPDTQKLIEGERGALSDRLESLNFSVESLTVKASDGTAGSAAADASNPGTASHGAAQQGQSGQGDPGARNGRSLGGDSRNQPYPRAPSGEPGGVADSGERLF